MIMKKYSLPIGLIAALAFAPLVLAQQSAQEKPPQTPAQQSQTQDQQNSQAPRIVRNVNLVDVLFSVLNRRQKLVTDLTKENFKVFDDGIEQNISSFSQPTDLPLRVGVLLDTSNSIRDRLSFEQESAIEFLFNVIRPEKDQAFLMTFDDGPQLIQDFTGDTGRLRDVILKQRAGGGTALYDAVSKACQHLMNDSPMPNVPNPEVRRVLVMISDGDDNLSNRSRGQAIEMAERAGVIVYSISTSTEWVTLDEEQDPQQRANRKYHLTDGDKNLQQMADETGGRAFYPYRVDDLGQSFLDIGDELRHQYSLAYSPSGRMEDGKFHTVVIKTDRKDVQVRSRKGYFAVANPPRASAPSPQGN